MPWDIKTCVRCGRRYTRMSNRQRFCSPECRFSYVPRAATTFGERSCQQCSGLFEAQQPHHVFCSAACRYRARPSDHSSRYNDPAHRNGRKAWESAVAGGRIRCARGAACCYAEPVDGRKVGGIVKPDEPWHLGHADGESVGGPEHVRCNAGAPSRLPAKNQKPPDDPPLRHSRDW
jgi:hypothetical protein